MPPAARRRRGRGTRWKTPERAPRSPHAGPPAPGPPPTSARRRATASRAQSSGRVFQICKRGSGKGDLGVGECGPGRPPPPPPNFPPGGPAHHAAGGWRHRRGRRSCGGAFPGSGLIGKGRGGLPLTPTRQPAAPPPARPPPPTPAPGPAPPRPAVRGGPSRTPPLLGGVPGAPAGGPLGAPLGTRSPRGRGARAALAQRVPEGLLPSEPYAVGGPGKAGRSHARVQVSASPAREHPAEGVTAAPHVVT